MRQRSAVPGPPLRVILVGPKEYKHLKHNLELRRPLNQRICRRLAICKSYFVLILRSRYNSNRMLAILYRRNSIKWLARSNKKLQLCNNQNQLLGLNVLPRQIRIFPSSREYCVRESLTKLSPYTLSDTTSNTEKMIEILIFGAGAIGAFYGSRLAQNKNVNVSVVCRSNFKAVKAGGFSVTSPQFGDYKWVPTRTFPDAAEAVNAKVKWDYVVVSTKALPDVSDDSELLQGLVSPGTAIVLIQNGLGVEEPYLARFPDAVVLGAVTITSAAQPEHGHIKHNRWTRINSGPYPEDSGMATKKNDAFNELLVSAGIKDASSYSAKKMQLLRWHKIAINAAMNPSSVLSGGSDNQSMANDPDMQEHVLGVMNEVFDVAQKLFDQPFPKEFATPEQILRSTKKNSSGSKPSMQLDWADGKKMELEVILGAPIRIAKAKGLDMPRLQAMYALLKTAQRNREQSLKAKI